MKIHHVLISCQQNYTMQVRTNAPKARTISLTIIGVAAAMGTYHYLGLRDEVVWILLASYTLLLLGSLYKGL